MQCLECATQVERLDNEHLLGCSGLTLHEYAVRHHLPLDLLLHPDQVNTAYESTAWEDSATVPGEAARTALLGLRWGGLIQATDPFVEVPGEIRRLDLLLWDLDRLRGYGFWFRQEYRYSGETHRVVARSSLRAPAANLARARALAATPEPPPIFLDALAVFLGHVAEYHAGYLLMPFAEAGDAKDVAERLRRDHAVACTELDFSDLPGGRLLRTCTRADGDRLLDLVRERLQQMPGGWDRFQAEMPAATVSKELVFDAAHFITDHPAKCSNLHGGRYLLQVQVSGRIDPVTGCVVDYGYLKRVVSRLVVERFDHHTLNYAAAELAWRSSTEMLCVYIWEQLIEYLPGLSGLRLYETTQSWCDYKGPTLEEYQRLGRSTLISWFQRLQPSAGRRELAHRPAGRLRAVGG
jgi:6-pyruvoyl tetrahydropterin synthase/QueD family protein